MKDHNTTNLALQREIGRLSAKLKVRDEIIRLRDERIGELEAEIVRKDDQMRELQHQLAAAKRDSVRLDWLEARPVNVENFTRASVDAAMAGNYP